MRTVPGRSARKPSSIRRRARLVLLAGATLAGVAIAGCTLDDHDSASLAAESQPGDVVRLAQYNVQFLLPEGTPDQVIEMAEHFPDDPERASLIGQGMACRDIVSFNESSNDARRADIFAAMEAHAAGCGRPALVDGGARFFDFASGPDNSQTSPVLDDEIAIASRFPIIEVHSTIYGSCSDIDCLADKGALHARVWRGPGHPARDAIDVFATHLNDGDDGIQTQQLEQLKQFILQHRDPGIPVIVMGDFNIGGNDGQMSDPGSFYNATLMRKLREAIPDLVDLGAYRRRHRRRPGRSSRLHLRRQRPGPAHEQPDGLLRGQVPSR